MVFIYISLISHIELLFVLPAVHLYVFFGPAFFFFKLYLKIIFAMGVSSLTLDISMLWDDFCKYFLSFCRLTFQFVDKVFILQCRNFGFGKIPLDFFAFVACVFVPYLKNWLWRPIWRDLSVFSYRSIMVSDLTFN